MTNRVVPHGTGFSSRGLDDKNPTGILLYLRPVVDGQDPRENQSGNRGSVLAGSNTQQFGSRVLLEDWPKASSDKAVNGNNPFCPSACNLAWGRLVAAVGQSPAYGTKLMPQAGKRYASGLPGVGSRHSVST
jgi:hypothetical protein